MVPGLLEDVDTDVAGLYNAPPTKTSYNVVLPLSPIDQAKQGVTPTWAPTFSRKAGGRYEFQNLTERAGGFHAILPLADFSEL